MLLSVTVGRSAVAWRTGVGTYDAVRVHRAIGRCRRGVASVALHTTTRAIW